MWSFSLLLVLAHAAPNLKKVASCEAPKDAKKVMLVKQWHLAPTTTTKSFREKYPQEKNQTAIYSALNDLVKKKKLQLLVAEGCEGELNSEFKISFNGWDYDSLKAQAHTRGYPRIITNVALKLEARHGDKLLTICGDNEKLIQEGNLRLSNLRGWVGFWSRLNEEGTNPEKLKLFTDSAADLLKVSRDSSIADLRVKIREQIREETALFSKSISDRNTDFVKALEGREFKTAAIVIGGLHAKDLKEKLQAAGYACDVMEPYGYQRSDEKLLESFEKAFK